MKKNQKKFYIERQKYITGNVTKDILGKQEFQIDIEEVDAHFVIITELHMKNLLLINIHYF